MNKTILLQACCAPCTSGVWQKLKNDYDIILFWYNPNIAPKEEHDRRRDELIRFANKIGVKILVGSYDYEHEHKYWLNLVSGLENEPERGRRCEICYKMRLEATAFLNDERKFDFFGTELSISPHKDAEKINQIGLELEKEHQTKYFVADFKKADGFKNSLILSKEHSLYRQSYCGCEYSKIKDQK